MANNSHNPNTETNDDPRAVWREGDEEHHARANLMGVSREGDERERPITDRRGFLQMGGNFTAIAAQIPARAKMEGFVKNILEVIEDALNNRDTGGGELDMIANIAQRIGDIPGFSGLASFAQHAVMLNAERQSNNVVFDGIQNFWERIKDEIKKEENQKFVMADFAGDVAQNAQQNAINQNDYSKTYTNDQLDSMEWEGNADDIWNIGGNNISRKDAFGAGKKARDNWKNSKDAKDMSPEDRARVDQQFSQYLQAIKNNDPNKAKDIYDKMPPSAKAHIDAQNAKKVAVEFDTMAQNSARTETVHNSTDESEKLFKSAVNTNQGTENFALPPSAPDTAIKRPLVLVNHFGAVNGAGIEMAESPPMPSNLQFANNDIAMTASNPAPASPPVLGGFKRG